MITEERLTELELIADSAASNGVNAPAAIRELVAEVQRLQDLVAVSPSDKFGRSTKSEPDAEMQKAKP